MPRAFHKYLKTLCWLPSDQCYMVSVTGETLLLVAEGAASWVQHISRADFGLSSGLSSSSQLLIVPPMLLLVGSVESHL
jgi:hypothetical protein